MTRAGTPTSPADVQTESSAFARELEFARWTGFKGGFISRHRALLFSPMDASKLVQAAALMVGLVVLWYLLMPLVSRFWGATMLASAQILNLVGAVNRPEHLSIGGLLEFEVPALYVPVGPPPRWVWEVGAALAAVLMAVSFVLPERYLPLAYLLRAAAGLQLVSQVFFAFWPNDFPYTAGGYIETMLVASSVLIWLIPVILALTYYLFDFTITQKLALSGMIMGHLTIMVPLQYVAHAFVLYHLSLLFLPLLFFAFSLPLNVFVFVAFYGWGFSWHNPLRDQEVQRRIRVR